MGENPSSAVDASTACQRPHLRASNGRRELTRTTLRCPAGQGIPPVQVYSVPTHDHRGPPASAPGRTTPESEQRQMKPTPLRHPMQPPLWLQEADTPTFDEQAGIEKFWQTHTPPSSPLGQAQPQGTFCGQLPPSSDELLRELHAGRIVAAVRVTARSAARTRREYMLK
jgi:hypothetical protein